MNDTSLNDATANTGGDNQQAAATDANKTATDANAADQQQDASGDKAAPNVADKAAPDAAAEGDKKPADDAAKPDAKADADKQGKDAKDNKADKKEGDKKPDDKKATVRAPEKYEDFKLAEGVKLAPELKGKFEAVARELDLPQADAQKLLDMAPELNKAFAAELVDIAGKTSLKWADETKQDKEIGGGGDKATLDKNLALVAKARDAFATPELLALLAPFDAKTNPNGTGFGNHPEVVRLFMRLGGSISEDNKLVTGSGSKQEQTAAQKLYSKTTPK